jgi:hypothetical protein
VWLEFMLPLLALRNYSKFVVEYLKGLLKLHNAESFGKVAKTQDGTRSRIFFSDSRLLVFFFDVSAFILILF